MLLYDGNGTVVASGDASTTGAAPGRQLLTVTPSSGMEVRVVGPVSAANPVRNIRIVPAAI